MSIFTHVVLGTNDLDKAQGFYDAALGALGYSRQGAFGANGMMYGATGPEFIVTKPGNGAPATHANGGTLGFAASDRAAVRAFHEAALANGGTDEGAPGPRAFTPTAYAAYVRDPDGNKLCAYSFTDE
ncbi:MAG: glyoxalase [Sphingomonas sp. SCN 67-18]|uniref:VOC family protein n=1 Tax=uncultured Sphingomonas sp. TaxID=158754 RepID=UPI00086D867E|nr:VOC family protein [Sphingomonas sp. SCN 67-18]ODU22899.1 MAG: glyoxalase [Sphingomonas sp. SCN 67-18]